MFSGVIWGIWITMDKKSRGVNDGSDSDVVGTEFYAAE